MAKTKKVITSLHLRDGELDSIYIVGEETHYGRVESISFRGDRHTTTGASYTSCYMVTFLGSTLELVIPLHSVKFITTDVTKAENDEDVGNTPELPD